ncbi:SDR family oxidoreductase [Nitrososphaera sp.]|uniref:SDR family oxidoreductase n=1 Tax=Nitrososphaera sp. TaxID=1971748 RepID=UPI00307EE8C4
MGNEDAAMSGRVCLVTGATSGIGKEIAAGLARMGAAVVIVGRDRSKCKAAALEIGNGENEKISYLVADLSSQAEVRRLAGEFLDRHSRLHVLVNNAGVFAARRAETVDGIEVTFAVNHLAPFMLTALLAKALAADSRVVTTSSVAHRGAQIDFDDIEFQKRPYSGIKAYSQSKLANILFTRELARRLPAGVLANCFHPGAVRTNLVRNGMYGAVWSAAGPFMASPQKGADTGIHLASSPEVTATGKYFVKRREEQPSGAAMDDSAAKRLWELSEKTTNVGVTL